MNNHRQRRYFQIEIWRGIELVEVIALTTRRSVAYAAFAAACRLRLAPGLEIVMREGGMTIAHRDQVPNNDNRRDR